MAQPRLMETTRLFFRVGTTAFGGGDPTIAILQREFYRRDWLSPGSIRDRLRAGAPDAGNQRAGILRGGRLVSDGGVGCASRQFWA